jgi:hypothetical protein
VAVARSEEKKICPTCGRTFAWQAKWAEVWDSVVYCNRACSGRHINAADQRIEALLLDRAAELRPGASFCPSEVAQEAVAQIAEDDTSWRELMPDVRRAVNRLAARGEIEVTQRGRRIDAARAHGPIRIKK